MRNLFYNLSLKYKLSLGFGLVLLFAIFIGLQGMQSISEIRTSTDLQGAGFVFNNYMYQLNEESEAFASTYNAENIKNFNNLYSIIYKNISAEKGNLNSVTHSNIADQEKELLEQYKSSFENLTNVAQKLSTQKNNIDSLFKKTINEINNLQLNNKDNANVAAGIANFKVTYMNFYYHRLVQSDNSSLLKNYFSKANNQLGELSSTIGQPESLNNIKLAVQQLYQAIQDFNIDLNNLSHIVPQNKQLGQDIMAKTGKLEGLLSQIKDKVIINSYIKISVVIAIAALLGIGASFIIGHDIYTTLSKVVSIAQKIGDGDLSGEYPNRRKDEFGALMHAVNKMHSNLKNLLNQVKLTSEHVASASSELSAVTEQTSAGAQTQKAETDQVAAAMNEMTTSAIEIAKNVELVASSAQESAQETGQANAQLATTIQLVETLSKQMTTSSSAMGQVVESSDKIGSIMDVIIDIAEQTNLLALNAAIEAARAGEAGRGFAVVADEVRKLASRTQQSTSEIENLISTLRAHTDQTSQQVNSSVQTTQQLREQSQVVSLALDKINQLTHNIENMGQQIATGAEEQSAVCEEINQNVSNVRDITDQSAAASSQIVAASAELARLGNELQDLVSTFRLQ